MRRNGLVLWLAKVIEEVGIIILGIWVVGMVLLVAAERSPQFAETALSQALPDDVVTVVGVVVLGLALTAAGHYLGAEAAQREEREGCSATGEGCSAT